MSEKKAGSKNQSKDLINVNLKPTATWHLFAKDDNIDDLHISLMTKQGEHVTAKIYDGNGINMYYFVIGKCKYHFEWFM